MRKLLMILGGVVVAIAVAFGWVWVATGKLADRADAFFALGAQGRIDEAHSALSSAAKASTAPDELRAFFEDSALTSFGDASWTQRTISGGRGDLEGVVTSEDGVSVPVRVVLLREQDEWMIHSVTRVAAGLQVQQSLDAPAVPDIEQQKALADQGMDLFVSSIKAGSMKPFYEGISGLWQRQTSVEELEQVFGDFFRISDFDWGQLSRLEPVIDRPAEFDEDGVLLISGHYPSHPYRMMFQQRFYREGSGWKLLGFSAEM